MLGVFEDGENSTGTSDPTSESFLLRKITLTTDDDQNIELVDQTVKIVKIINQTQILFKKEIPKTVAGKTFKLCTIEFDPTLLASSTYAKDQTIILANPSLEYSSPFSIPQARNANFVIKVKWKNSVVRSSEDPPQDLINEPSFELSFTGS